jgi:plasmid replication initiation protein
MEKAQNSVTSSWYDVILIAEEATVMSDGKEVRSKRSTLSIINSLSSLYSIQLYEMLAQVPNSKTLKVNLNDLVRKMNLPYKRYSEIARRVIKPAIQELNEKSNLILAWKPVKGGRFVTMVEFEIVYAG